MSVHTFAKHWHWTITLSTEEYSKQGQRWLQRGKESSSIGMNVGKWTTYPARWSIKDFKILSGGKTIWIKGIVYTRTPIAKAVVIHHLERAGPKTAKVNVWSTIAPGLMVGRKNAGWRGYINSFKDF